MKNLKSFVVLAFFVFVSLLCFACPSPKVEQTAPEWAIGTWYEVAEGGNNEYKVIVINQNSYQNITDDTTGAEGPEIFYDKVTEGAATVKNTITVKSDTEFKVEQHDEGMDIITFHLRKSNGKYEFSRGTIKGDDGKYNENFFEVHQKNN